VTGPPHDRIQEREVTQAICGIAAAVDRRVEIRFLSLPVSVQVGADCPMMADLLSLNKMTVEQKSALAGVVTIDKEIMHGTPCFAHTRVPLQTLIDFLETGETIDDFLAVYPSILRQHVFSFLELSRDIAIDQLECASL
jgi:uncharacterized protein (DUF433 family)